MTDSKMPRLATCLAAAAGAGAAAYATYVAATWWRYGKRQATAETDTLLDVFMSDYEVGARHEIAVRAPADVAFAIACGEHVGDSAIVKALFTMREWIFGAPSQRVTVAGGLVEQIKAVGWAVLAEEHGREIVFGAVTQPWKADVAFRAVGREDFARFAEPGYVKIIWTLRADPVGDDRCLVSTETRVATTSPDARARFRWYWSFLSPGIKLIRLVMLSQIKCQAERQAAGVPAVAA
jgi:hypothetical protein